MQHSYTQRVSSRNNGCQSEKEDKGNSSLIPQASPGFSSRLQTSEASMKLQRKAWGGLGRRLGNSTKERSNYMAAEAIRESKKREKNKREAAYCCELMYVLAQTKRDKFWS